MHDVLKFRTNRRSFLAGILFNKQRWLVRANPRQVEIRYGRLSRETSSNHRASGRDRPTRQHHVNKVSRGSANDRCSLEVEIDAHAADIGGEIGAMGADVCGEGNGRTEGHEIGACVSHAAKISAQEFALH